MTKAKGNSGGTPATRVLDQAGIGYTLHAYGHSDGETHFGDEASAALGIDPTRVFKTLLAEVVGRRTELVVAVVPVAGQLDLKALAAAVGGKKASMADPATAERVTGMVVGGITSIGQRIKHRTVVDESASRFETVFVSAGKRGVSMELSPADLVSVTDASYAPIGR